VLVLDAGSSLMGHWVSMQSKGELTVKAMNLMGYDALAVGRLEMAAGLDSLVEQAAEAEFAILSSNLVDSVTGDPLLKPYELIERGGATIAIIGATETSGLVSIPGGLGSYEVVDPVETVAQYADELRDSVDVILVLSHAGKETDRRIASEVPGIAAIIGGNNRELMREPERVGKTYLIQMGYRGEWMGVFRMSVDADGVPTDAATEIVTLDSNWTEDPTMEELVAPYRDKYPSPTPRPTWTPDPRTPTANWTATIQAYQTLVQETRAATEADKE